MEKNSKKDLLVTLAVLLVIVIIVTGTINTKKKDPVVTTTAVTTTEPAIITQPSTVAKDTASSAITTEAVTTTTVQNKSGYKDGTYSASGQYSTPESTETISVSVTLKDGVITDTTATEKTVSSDSQEYVKMFLDNYKKLVIGIDISKLKLSRVSGSSLTSQGFNTAIQIIESQAKV